MVTKRYEFDDLLGSEINLGRVGENKVRCIEFDVRPWLALYPNSFVMIFVVPPSPNMPYRPGVKPAPHAPPPGYIAATEFADGIVSWPISSTDTQHSGTGAAELILYGTSGEVMQSTVIKTRISQSISHTGGCGCAPSPMQPWVDQVAQLRIETEEAAERAEAAVEAIEQAMAESQKSVFNATTHYDFPSIGSENVIYKAQGERKTYQWNPSELKYEPLDQDIEDNNIIYGGDANGTD